MSLNFYTISLVALKHIAYCDKPIRVESVDETGHEAHLTGRCQDVKVEVCDRTEWGPVETKPADKEKKIELALAVIARKQTALPKFR